MKVSINSSEKSMSTCEVFNVTVSGLTMGELLELAEKNFRKPLAHQKVFLCSVVAIAACRQADKPYADVSVSVPQDSSLALIGGVTNNLSLNKKTRMVLNTALNNPSRRKTYTLTGFSGSKTWGDYVGPMAYGTRQELIEIRLKMVREAFANNPDFVFPDMTYTIYHSE